MTLTECQHEAWDCAEAKGFHADLDGGVIADQRNLALAALGAVYEGVTVLAQSIKRHGISPGAFQEQRHVWHVVDLLALFLNGCEDGRPPWVDMQACAATIRLTLLHTEVSEAHQALRNDPSRTSALEELADIVIRTAELAEVLGGNLEAAVQAKTLKNRRRPRLYGTPQEVPAS